MKKKKPLGYIKMTARKTLRATKPHGRNRKQNEPTIEEGLRDMERIEWEIEMLPIKFNAIEFYETDVISTNCNIRPGHTVTLIEVLDGQRTGRKYECEVVAITTLDKFNTVLHLLIMT